VIVRVDFKTFGQRDHVTFDLVQTAVHRVEAVGNIRKQDRFVVLQKALKNMRQNLIGAVTNEDLAGFDAKVDVVRRDRLLQSQPFRVRIQARSEERRVGKERNRRWSKRQEQREELMSP